MSSHDESDYVAVKKTIICILIMKITMATVAYSTGCGAIIEANKQP
jgi:hypothetical protein